MFNTINNNQKSSGFISTISTGNNKVSTNAELIEKITEQSLPIIIKGITKVVKIIISK